MKTKINKIIRFFSNFILRNSEEKKILPWEREWRAPAGNKNQKEFKYGVMASLIIAFFVVSGASLFLRLVEVRIIQPIEKTERENVAEADIVVEIEGSHVDYYLRPETVKKDGDPAESERNISETEIKKKLKEKKVKIISWEGIKNLFLIPTASAESGGGYKVKMMISSEKIVSIKAGEKKSYIIGFKNIGSSTWNGDNNIGLRVSDPADRQSPFRADNWEKQNQPASLSTASVKPGEIGFFSFEMAAPSVAGKYIENFALFNREGEIVEGGRFAVMVVVEDAIIPTMGIKEKNEHHENQPSENTQKESKIVCSVNGAVAQVTESGLCDGSQKEEEPIMRVGLYAASSPVQLTANGRFSIRDGSNNRLAILSPDTQVTLSHDQSTSLYTYSFLGGSTVKNSKIRIVPEGENVIIELLNYTRKVSWNPSINDNRFRGVIEFSYSPKSGSLWVINELPMEDYLKGVDETSDFSPKEFQKALAIAARTYAMHHYLGDYKHKKNNFTVDATYDQVYKGYNSELRHPGYSQAVEATKGHMVTYQGEIAVTPYYSRSDGRTRSWEEVWYGGPYGWLKSVPDPYCRGESMLGHGVGMSAVGAIRMANNDNSSYLQILKHYYTGIEVEKVY